MFEAIFLGILQGLTEFLPISSSAHIRIVGEFLPSAADPGAAFTAITQIGTELAVLIYFWGDIRRIISAWLRSLFAKRSLGFEDKTDARLGWLIIVGSLPIVILGYFGRDFIEKDLRSLWLIASALIVFGLILGLADYLGVREKSLKELTVGQGILYGIAQSMALIPGVSRSGATIAMGRFLGFKREAALRYSFLLALPAVFGSGLFELKSALEEPDKSPLFSMSEIFVATSVAFIVGFAVIAWLMRFVTTKSFRPFVIYRVALGVLVLILLSTGVISA